MKSLNNVEAFLFHFVIPYQYKKEHYTEKEDRLFKRIQFAEKSNFNLLVIREIESGSVLQEVIQRKRGIQTLYTPVSRIKKDRKRNLSCKTPFLTPKPSFMM